MVICTFNKCGISTAPDGSEDDQVSIRTLPDYVMSKGREEDFDLCTDDDNSGRSDDDNGNSSLSDDEGITCHIHFVLILLIHRDGILKRNLAEINNRKI